VYRVTTGNCLQEPNAHSDPGIALSNGCSRAAQVPQHQHNLQLERAAQLQADGECVLEYISAYRDRIPGTDVPTGYRG
jgi:hypothetical protein